MVVLADDAATFNPPRFRWGTMPSVKALVETIAYPDADTVTSVARKNLLGTFSFIVGQPKMPSGGTSASLGAAVLFCLKEPYEQAGKKGTLVLSDEGAEVTVQNVILEAVNIVGQIGAYILVEYHFTGGNL